MHGNWKVSLGLHREFAALNPSIVDRVQWFRARADMSRVKEEINKLHAEFKRTRLGFDNMAQAWDVRTGAAELSEGAKAYAKKKASMFRTLASNCAAAFAKVRRDPEEKWDYSRVRNVRYIASLADGRE